MSAFLRERCRLHQSVVDSLIDSGIRVNDSLRVVLTDDGNRFPFTVRSFKAEMAAMHRLIYSRLIHRAHGLHRKGCSRGRLFDCLRGRLFDCLRGCLLDCLRRLFRSYSHRFFSACAHRFSQEFSGSFRNRRLGLCRDHLDYIVCYLIASTVASQRGRHQALGTSARAESHRNQCCCQCYEDSSSPHEREVCRKSKAMASFFFDKNRWRLVVYLGRRFRRQQG